MKMIEKREPAWGCWIFSVFGVFGRGGIAKNTKKDGDFIDEVDGYKILLPAFND